MSRHIYVLEDPRDQSVRYVGQTRDLEMRLKNHLNNPVNPEVGEWVRELKSLGMVPNIRGVAIAPDLNVYTEEGKWIRHYIGAGAKLLNRDTCPIEKRPSKTNMFSMRLPPPMEKAFRKAAREAGLTLSKWVVTVCDKAVQEI